MTLSIKSLTLDEFITYVHLPENSERRFEYVNGEVVETSLSTTYNASLANLIGYAIHVYCKTNNIPYYTTSGDGACNIQGSVIAPDFAYKPTPMSNDYPDPVPPVLAVEIISPTDEPARVRNKRILYQQAGILYWEIYPEEKSADVYAPDQPTRTLGIDDALDGGSVIPGFTLAIRDLFAQ